MQLNDLQYHDSQQKLVIRSLFIDWQPSSLFNHLLKVKTVRAANIVYSSGTQQNDEPLSVPKIPIPVQLDHVLLDSLSLSFGDDTALVNSIAFRATSRDETLNLDDIVVAYQNHKLVADSKIQLAQQLPFSASIHWQGVIPEIGRASASSEISGNLNTIQFDLVTESPVQIKTSGQLSFEQATPMLSVQGQWQKLQWPLTSDPTLTADSGNFTLKGPIETPAITVSSLVRFPLEKIPALQTHLAGQLTQSGIESLQAEIQVPKGIIHSRGSLHWSPGLKGNLQFDAQGIDTAGFFSDWPGSISFTATALGGIDQEALWLDTNLSELTGTLHGQPLKARGNVRYANNILAIESLNITSGLNTLSTEGKISQQLDLIYSLHAPQLDTSWPAFSGELSANGSLGGKLSDPTITAEITGSGLVYEQHKADQLQASLVWQQQQARGKLLVNGFSLPGINGRQLLAQVNGTPLRHDLQLSLQSSELQLEIVGQGNWQAPQWQGQLALLQIDQHKAGRWMNSQPVVLKASADSFKLEHSCFQQQESRLCTGLQWQNAIARIEARLEKLPLKNLLQYHAPQADIDGLVHGTVSLNGPLDALQGTAMIELPSGQVSLDTDDALPLALKDGIMNLTLTPGGNRAKLQLIAGQADINAQIKTGPFTSSLPVVLDGSIQAQIPELSQLTPLMQGLTDVQGTLQLQASLTGTTQKPVVKGLLEVKQASASIPQLGLRLENTWLTAKNRGFDSIDIKAETRSGDGTLAVDGSLILAQTEGWPMQFKVTGQNVQLVRLPEAQVIASPDLNVKIHQQQINVDGTVSIPQAGIEIRELPKQAVTTSEDEIIIGQQQRIDEQPAFQRLSTNIDVTFGDKVSLKGFGLNTRFEGNVNLHSRQGNNLAKGHLSLLDGKYKAYGQDLTIEQGRLLFNGPPQNPDVDIRASRLSQDKEVTAILNVSGTLQKPLVSVSSMPSLPDEEALAYLLTGRGFGEEGPDRITMLRLAAASHGLEKSQEILDQLATQTGVDEISLQEAATLEETSLLLGKYLSPDLYVSYAMGLFDNQGALMTRYRLSNRLRLEVKSGTEQSMDLIYNVEK